MWRCENNLGDFVTTDEEGYGPSKRQRFNGEQPTCPEYSDNEYWGADGERKE